MFWLLQILSGVPMVAPWHSPLSFPFASKSVPQYPSTLYLRDVILAYLTLSSHILPYYNLSPSSLGSALIHRSIPDITSSKAFNLYGSSQSPRCVLLTIPWKSTSQFFWTGPMSSHERQCFQCQNHHEGLEEHLCNGNVAFTISIPATQFTPNRPPLIAVFTWACSLILQLEVRHIPKRISSTIWKLSSFNEEIYVRYGE